MKPETDKPDRIKGTDSFVHHANDAPQTDEEILKEYKLHHHMEIRHMASANVLELMSLARQEGEKAGRAAEREYFVAAINSRLRGGGGSIEDRLLDQLIAKGEQKGREDAMTYKCVFCHELGGAIGEQMIHVKCVNPKIAQLEQQSKERLENAVKLADKVVSLEQQLKTAKENGRVFKCACVRGDTSEKICECYKAGGDNALTDYAIDRHEFENNSEIINEQRKQIATLTATVAKNATAHQNREAILIADKKRLETEKQHLNEVSEALSFQVEDLLDVKVAYEKQNKILADALKGYVDDEPKAEGDIEDKEIAREYLYALIAFLTKKGEIAQKALHDAGDKDV
jgi:hypothetical protein